MANGAAADSVAGTSSPASAIPRTTPLLTSAARASSAVVRGWPCDSAATTFRRASVRRVASGSGSASRQPETGLGAVRFTRSAIASTSPGGASV